MSRNRDPVGKNPHPASRPLPQAGEVEAARLENAHDDARGRDRYGARRALTLLHLQGVAADRDQLRHRQGTANFGAADIIRCAKSLGLKARTYRTQWSRLSSSPLPAIAMLRDGSFMVIAKASADKVLVQSPVAQRPVLMERDEFAVIWDGGLILMTRRAGLSDLGRRIRHHLVHRRDRQIPAAVRRSAGGLVLPPAVCAGLAAVLPGRDRQGAGAPLAVHARRARHRPRRGLAVRHRARNPAQLICFRTRPTASTSSWARACSIICWRCRWPGFRPGASAIPWPGSASSRISAISSPARR